MNYEYTNYIYMPDKFNNVFILSKSFTNHPININVDVECF